MDLSFDLHVLLHMVDQVVKLIFPVAVMLVHLLLN